MVKQALEDRRSAYSGGAVLLNLTSHDEVLPDNDAWLDRVAHLLNTSAVQNFYTDFTSEFAKDCNGLRVETASGNVAARDGCVL